MCMFLPQQQLQNPNIIQNWNALSCFGHEKRPKPCPKYHQHSFKNWNFFFFLPETNWVFCLSFATFYFHSLSVLLTSKIKLKFMAQRKHFLYETVIINFFFLLLHLHLPQGLNDSKIYWQIVVAIINNQSYIT